MDIRLFIDKKEYTDYLTLPIQIQETIDKSLDIAYIELVGLDFEEPLQPFTKVLIQIDNNNYGFLIESDKVTEIINLKKYNHDILLIEETKELERFYTSKTVQQPLYIEEYNIKQVIEILLQTTETLRENEFARYELAELHNYNNNLNYDENDLIRVEEIFNMISPEFNFTNQSLFESLQQVGNYANFIPRLIDNKIYFDLLNRDKILQEEKYTSYFSNVLQQESEKFCSALNSNINNLVNKSILNEGAVTTDFKTFRTEKGSIQVKDNNLIIPTQYPIEKIIKLEIGYIENLKESGTDDTILENHIFVGDITNFVYEIDEYNTLSSYDNDYPYSKMYALYYTTNEKDIKGLSFKRDNVISQALENFAIENIINKKLDKNITTDLFKITCKITYIPQISTILRQYKENVEDLKNNVFLAYNQTASKVDSEMYGSLLRNVIKQYGNEEQNKMFILPKIDNDLKCGIMFKNNVYISLIKKEIYQNFILYELGLTKNYTNENARIEVNNQQRFYAIDNKKLFDRYLIFEEFCEIGTGDTNFEIDNNLLINRNGIETFKSNLVGSLINFDEVKSCYVACYDIQNNLINKLILPVITINIGNSILFSFKFEDNYSGGDSVFYDENGKYQKSNRYVDINGELEKIELKFGNFRNSYSNYNEYLENADNLPLAKNISGTTYFGTNLDYEENNKIVVKKSSNEVLNLAYQLHFVKNDKDLIFGKDFTSQLYFVNKQKHNFNIYFLYDKLSKNQTTIDFTKAVKNNYVDVFINEANGFRIANLLTPINDLGLNYKSWVICNENGIVLLGKNIDMAQNKKIPDIYFKFKRRI